ncbi:MAG: hypothetical protein PHC92_05820 [Syntrophomonadaceae bacterium]|nr:hypothetical protein [Syntrophomonadaceae bacterium]MDD3024114.1 hypothetical protein [Syntrophomonadaceae bacterium]
MKKARVLMLMALVCSLLYVSGCDFDVKRLLEPSTAVSEEKLFKAEIVFSSTDKVVAYIKSLGVEKNGQVYVGGASLCYLYDSQGNIIGSYNYQRVLYIKIISEKNKEN